MLKKRVKKQFFYLEIAVREGLTGEKLDKAKEGLNRKLLLSQESTRLRILEILGAEKIDF